MKVLITGANGFLGKNLSAFLMERDNVNVLPFTRNDNISKLREYMPNIDFVFHFAGINRPKNTEEFKVGNVNLTQELCNAIVDSGKHIPLIFTSSIQAGQSNPYGESKQEAEKVLSRFSNTQGSPIYLFRLPNVFGKWVQPNYNSVVATFCHNIANDLPIQINDPNAAIKLVYIDDVISHFISILDNKITGQKFNEIEPQYNISIGDLADIIRKFRNSRNTLLTEAVGTGLYRALYSTYVSYLPPERFSYTIPKHEDSRGLFVEMLKTHDSGQFSFFTAHPGIIRGGHYHHSKTEKFLVIKGNARFRFRHIFTGEFYELVTNSDEPKIVETVPGWSHDITNIGDDEMIVMLWANELFNKIHPDTYTHQV